MEIVQVLVKYYGYKIKSRKGSHVWMVNDKGNRTTVLASNEQVNMHNYKSILKQTGLSKDELEQYL
jgi:predicted RNA binding protein YcfA (HicA-like mRNA interferase family)